LEKFLKLLIKDTHFGITDLSTQEKSLIENRFTYKDASQAMTRAGFNEKKVKKVKFAISKNNALILRSGFLQEFLKFAKEFYFKVEEIKDQRTRYDFQKKEFSYDELRTYFNPDFKYVDHQIRALKALLKTNWGIIKAPTSAGKTEIIIGLIKISKLPTLILVDNITLALQTMERIEEAGLSCGICTGKGKLHGTHMVSTIGSVKKLSLSQYQCVIVDECHIAAAARFQEFFTKTSYSLRYGFSATPDGNDKYRFATIRQFLGDVIAEVYTDELMENEVITPPEIHFKQISCIPTMDWQAAYDCNIVKHSDRNRVAAEIANESGVPTLVLYKIIDHGKELAKLIPNSILLSGDNDSAEREDAIHKFKKGEVRVLIASNIFKQGISINNIQTLINVSGGKSKIEVLQKLGRALRKHPGKDVALVYDFLDKGNDFTYKHSLQRMKLYKDTGYTNIIIDKD
jgi:superfamily II DNA or RNA helicase